MPMGSRPRGQPPNLLVANASVWLVVHTDVEGLQQRPLVSADTWGYFGLCQERAVGRAGGGTWGVVCPHGILVSGVSTQNTAAISVRFGGTIFYMCIYAALLGEGYCSAENQLC